MTIRSPDAYYPPGEGPDPTASPAPVPVTPPPSEPAEPRLTTLPEIIAAIDLDKNFQQHQESHDYRLPPVGVALGWLYGGLLVLLLLSLAFLFF